MSLYHTRSTHRRAPAAKWGVALRLWVGVAFIFAIIAQTANAQIVWLGGSVSGIGTWGRAWTNPDDASSGTSLGGQTGLLGRAIVADRLIGDISFRFNLNQQLSWSSGQSVLNNSWGRTVDWYDVNGSFLSSQPISFTVGSSLTAQDLTGSTTVNSVEASTGAFGASIFRNQGSVALKLGGVGMLNANGFLMQTSYRGVVQDTLVRTRGLGLTYSIRGDKNEAMVFQANRNETDGGSGTPVAWSNNVSLAYDGFGAGTSVSANASYFEDQLGSQLQTILNTNTQITDHWMTYRNVNGLIYRAGTYLRGNLLLNQQFTFTDTTGFGATLGGQFGYGGTYTEGPTGEGSLVDGMLGGGSGSAFYTYSLDSAKTVSMSTNATASSFIQGVGQGATTTASVGQTAGWRMNSSSSLSGSLLASHVFVPFGATSIGQTMAYSTSLDKASVTIGASHGTRITPMQDSSGTHTTIYEDFYSWQGLSGAFFASDVTYSLNSSERFLNWSPVDLSVQANAHSELIRMFLTADAGYGYSISPQNRLQTHRGSLTLTMQWRAISIQARGSYVYAAGRNWSEVRVTIRRGFRLI